MQSSITQDSLEKNFFEQLKSGDYVDVKHIEGEWKLAKVIDKQNKALAIIFDGYPPENQQAYINSMRVRPLRAVTSGYTGPHKHIYTTITSIAELKKQIALIDTIIIAEQPYSAYKVTQYLRGQLFTTVNSLLLSELNFQTQEIQEIYRFFVKLIERIAKICEFVKKEIKQYFQANLNNKLIYLSNQKIALLYSLDELLYLIQNLIAPNSQMPKLIKIYKGEINQENLIEHLKAYIKLFLELYSINDGNGRWLPTKIRIRLAKILMRFKREEEIINVKYEARDYLQFYAIWPGLINFIQNKVHEDKLIFYIVAIILKPQAPFDAKLKSLQILKKILEKEIKMSFISTNTICEHLIKKNIIESLLQSFNPQIFKRYIPILSIISHQSKKSIQHSHIDQLFNLLENRHQSQRTIIYEIIVMISEFINPQILDYIYSNIETRILSFINETNGIKFITDFTINAIENYNANKNKGFFGMIIGKKKNSSRYQYYGLDLFYKQVQDIKGRVEPRNVIFVVDNIGIIFSKQCFHHQRFNYMVKCLESIDKRSSYGQSIKILQEIISSYPPTAIISEHQGSVVGKLDEKFHILDKMIKPLKNIHNPNEEHSKISLTQSIKYFYEFLEKYNKFFRNSINIEHLRYLWSLPHIFDYQKKKKKQFEDSEIPSWKKKYYKTIDKELIRDIFNKLLCHKESEGDKYIICHPEAFQTIDQLFISYNLAIKTLDMTEKITIRYNTIDGMVGLEYYFRLLKKSLRINGIQPLPPSEVKQKKQMKMKPFELQQKIITRIFDIYMRPYNQDAIPTKCKNWMICLEKVLNIITQFQNQRQMCLFAIEKFMEMIKGRKSKDIPANGKLQIIVSHDNKEKIINMNKNSTILKFREAIMQQFNIKTNFAMYNLAMKREVTYFEEEDFTVNAMPLSLKGPTINIRRAFQGSRYPQHEAREAFLQEFKQKQNIYTIIFQILTEEPEKRVRVWRLLDQLPINQKTIAQIRDIKSFTKQKWLEYMTIKKLELLQYKINIVFDLMSKKSDWMMDFIKSEGQSVVQELYLVMLNSNDSMKEKIILKLSNIMIKIIDHHKTQELVPLSENALENRKKISSKIFEIIERYALSTYLKPSEKQFSIECINLMMKWLLISCHKFKTPQKDQIHKFFLEEVSQKDKEGNQTGDKYYRLLLVADQILFEEKNEDTNHFTEEILEKIIFELFPEKKNLNVEKEQKEQQMMKEEDEKKQDFKIKIFQQFINKYLDYKVLLLKKSVDNYFMFLVDLVHRQINTQEEVDTFTPQIINKITDFVKSTIELQPSQNQIIEQILNGSLKLLNLFMSNQEIYKQHDSFYLFNTLLNSHIFNSVKLKNKTRKLIYDIVKKFCFREPSLTKIFIDKIKPRLQAAQWRTNTFMSWNLEQQKKQKKYFCGLENLGATCYINCLFQQLFMIKRFRDKFINVDSIAYRQTLESNQIYQLQKLLTSMKFGKKRSYSPKQFCESFITYEGLPIDPMIQSDADEFFNSLMDKIEAFLTMTENHKILEDTFEGKLSNQLNCQGCPHNSEKIENFLSIGLNIKEKKSLEEALDFYVAGEILDGDNAYYCQLCEKKVRTMKRLCIKELPNVMVIVLKRFSYNFDEMRKIKINDELRYPEEISMKNYTSEYLNGEEMRDDEYYHYKLRGVVVHSGTSDAGHYYSFIKQHSQSQNKNGQWYEFNDEIVDEAEFKRIEQESFGGEEKNSDVKMQKYKNAYILFYEKKVIEEDDLKVSKDLNQSEQEHEKIQVKKEEIKEKDEREEKQEQSQQDQATKCQLVKLELQKNESSKSCISYAEELAQKVIHENQNAEFLAILLDPLFIRICQNITMTGYSQCTQFLILYFHVVLMRDKNKEQNIGNLYRLILSLMEPEPNKQQNEEKNKDQGLRGPELCAWFINQIGAPYVTQFLLEAPKLPRYLCAGLVIHALKQIIQCGGDIPINFLNTMLFCMSKKKKGLNPMGKIFSYLSSMNSHPEYRQKLIQCEYPYRVINILQPKKYEIESILQFQDKDSYFYDGVMSNKNILNGKEKQLDPNISTLIESLKYYKEIINKDIALNLLESEKINLYRLGIKAMCQIVAYWNIGIYSNEKSIEKSGQVLINHDQIVENISTTIKIYEIRLKEEKYKKQDVQKYLFMIRYHYRYLNKLRKCCNKSDDTSRQQQKIIKAMIDTNIIKSLKKAIKMSQNSYMALELLITEINKIACVDKFFRKKFQIAVSTELQSKDKEKDIYGIMDDQEKTKESTNIRKSLNYWLKQSSHPHYMGKNQEWTSRISGLSFSEKQSIIRRNIKNQENRVQWMLEPIDKKIDKDGNQIKEEESEEGEEREEKYQKRCQQIYSDLDEVQTGKDIMVGYKKYRVLQKMCLLNKVENEDHCILGRSSNRWGVLQRNELDSIGDF